MPKHDNQKTGFKQFIAMIDEICEARAAWDGDSPMDLVNVVHAALEAPRTAEVQHGFERALAAYLVIAADGAVPDVKGMRDDLKQLAANARVKSAPDGGSHHD